MALPLHILERLPAELRRNSLIRDASSLLPVERLEGDVATELREGELSPGGVVEIALLGPGAWGTSLALLACRRAQRAGRWAGFIDPSASLHAPGVARAGLDLARLIVVEPELEALGRVAVRMAESQLFGTLVLDLSGATQSGVELPSGVLARVVRRLALAVERSSNSVLLLTSADAPRAVPLPVQRRIEVSRVGRSEIVARVSKDQKGRLSGPWRVNLRPLEPARHVA